jgi:uncharacterized protein (TIGR02145 family)
MKKLFIFIGSIFFISSLSAQIVDSIIDIRDNQVYKVVKIGQQWWMQENLNIGTRIDGSQNAADNGIIEKYCYDNNDSLCNNYGGLYQWNEMMDYNPTDNENTGTTRGVCLVGWHLPTDAEWRELVDYLGGESIVGGMMKESGTLHWSDPNTGATNISGFTALPGGCRDIGPNFGALGDQASFWSSTEGGLGTTWYRKIDYNSVNVYHNYWDKEAGYSVRCIRNAGQLSYLMVSDKNLNAISKLDFVDKFIFDSIIIINSAPEKTINITSIHTATPVYNMNKSSAVLSSGDSIHLTITFNSLIDGIYYFDTLKIESDDPFNPVIRIPLKGYKPKTDSIIDVRDQQVYKVVKIGQQWWMQENLNIGIRIDFTQDETNNGTIEKYCYEDNTNNCNIYGGLYQWDEMMDYNPSDESNPGITRGICMVGWHLPTDIEWTELTDFLGGQSVAGGKLKESGTTHWFNPNSGATNESGFTAIAGGYRRHDGWTLGMGYDANFWTTRNIGAPGGFFYRNVSCGKSEMLKRYESGIFGFSVRCLMDSSQFRYLTILDENLKTISKLNFNNDDTRKTLIIINSSEGKTINISSIYNNNFAFSLNHSYAILSPGDSLHFKIYFSPPVKDIYTDTLYLKSDDPYDSLIKIPLFGTFPLEISFTDSSNISCYGFSDGTATVTPSLGTPPYQYQWNDPGNTTDSTVTGLLANKDYRVTVIDALGWIVTDSIRLSEPEPLGVQSDFSDIICLGSSEGFINLNPSGGTPPFSYSWSNGAETKDISDLSAGSYNVTVTDNNGCEYSENIIINNSVPYENEKICIVTIDLISGKNLIIWEKTPDKGVEFYNIYREGTIIGTVPYNALSIFKDTVANPEKRPYLYNITAVDTCDNESAQSSYHKPLFLQYVSSVDGVNLTWSKYEVEDKVLDFDSYAVYRGSDRSSLSPIEENIPTEINVFTDNDPLALERKYYYRVAGVLNNPCYPTGTTGRKDEPGPYSFSMSNLEDNRILTPGTSDLTEIGLSVYPNPFGEYTTIIFNNPDGHDYTLYVMDLSGKVCKIISDIKTSIYILEKGDIQEGFYIIELRGPQLYRERIIVE